MSWSRRKTRGMSTRSSMRSSLRAFPPPCCRAARTRRKLACRHRVDRPDEHAVDATTIHLNDFEAPVAGCHAVGNHRHTVEARHQIAAQRVEIRILAGQLANTQHLLQLVEP